MNSFIKKNYHWVIAAVALLQIFFHVGLGNNFASVFVDPVSEGMGISRADFSLAYSMKSVAGFAVCFFSGSIFNRLGYRRSVFFGLSSAAVGYLLFAFSKNLPMAYVACFVIGGSNGLCATIGVTRILSEWFVRYRGTVLGLVTAASGLGGSIFCILQTAIIEAFSWRIALIFTASLLVILAIFVVIFTRNKPQDMGLRPYGDGEEIVQRRRCIADRPFPGLPMNKLIKRPAFYLTFLCFFLFNCGNYSALNTIIPHFKDVGYSATEATSFQSILLLLMAGTKFICGYFSDRFGAKKVTLVCALSGAVSLFLFPFAKNTSFAFAAVLFLAISMPLNSVLISLLGFSLFGTNGQKQYTGLFHSIIYVSNMTITPIANGLRDKLGSYDTSYSLTMCFMILSFFLLFLLYRLAEKDRKKSEETPA